MWDFFKKKVVTLAKGEDKLKSPIMGIRSIKELESYLNDTGGGDDLSFDQIVSIYNDPVVKSKSNLLLNKSKTYCKALNYDKVKVSVQKYIDWTLNKTMDWDSFDRYVFYSKIFGYSVILLKWQEDGVGGYDLIGSQHLNPESFSINTDINMGDIGDLMLNQINLTKDYPMNFICVKNDVSFEYPGGQSDLRQIKNTVAFKRFLEKEKQRYFKKASVPSIAVLYKSSKTGKELEEEADLFSQSMNNVEGGAGVALPNVESVVKLESNGQINFERTEEALNKIISVRILGSDLTDSQSKGTYGQASIGADYIEGNVKELGSVLQQTRNLVLKYAVYAKFGVENAPEYIYDFNEPYPVEYFTFMGASFGYCSAYEAMKTFPMPRGYKPPKDDYLYFKEIKELTSKEDPKDENNKDSNPDNKDDNSDNK